MCILSETDFNIGGKIAFFFFYKSKHLSEIVEV